MGRCMENRKIVLDYTGGRNQRLAGLIDNVTDPKVTVEKTRTGYRKCTWRSKRQESSRRVQTLARFCDGIYKRWEKTPKPERNRPLSYPLHRKHQPLNYIMSLVEDNCVVLFRDLKRLNQLFRMHQFVISLIYQQNQAEIAEIFCSGLLQVWIENGGGFKHYPAGLSNLLARNIIHEAWYDSEQYVLAHSPLAEGYTDSA
ncbi:hypothetical protein K469DRAFT_685249 [Zopfia rhizophila CBS 207.26]|uniref:Uncharacterized protein n=1 Tax=Zopfia rhizophila CBS 207.26 TaxID=1314779 RepID=A0A6A6EBE9_9PEZI|nr:hypothetical protein K469DRAFT_685249 [Zopfia rhizophila CBS 207.26]